MQLNSRKEFMMSEFLQYLLESSLCLAGFGALYLAFFRNLSHFNWNRSLLLGLLALSLALPLITIHLALPGGWSNGSALIAEALQTNSELVQTAAVPLETHIVENPAMFMQGNDQMDSTTAVTPSGWLKMLIAVWLAGGAWYALRLGQRLRRLQKLKRSGDRKMLRGVPVTVLPAGQGNFSFGKTIFMDEDTWTGPDREIVLAHESAHIQQGHSIDLLCFEMVRILFWFHPLMGLLQRELQAIHEYLADATAGSNNPVQYSRKLLELAVSGPSVPPSHGFARSQIRKRILMLNQNPSHPMSKLKYALFLPLIGLFMMAFVVAPAAPELTEEKQEIKFAGEIVPISNPQVAAKYNSIVQKITSNPERMQMLQQRTQKWHYKLSLLLRGENIPEDFVYLAVAESHLNPEAKSSIGALGMWQMMPQTARECGLEVSENEDQRLNPEASTKAAARYLQMGYTEFGSWIAAAAAYNKGIPGLRKVMSSAGSPEGLFTAPETQNYLLSVVAMKQLLVGNPTGEVKSNPPSAHPLGDENTEVTSGFGHRHNPVKKAKDFHKGIDLKASTGTKIFAPASGLIESAEFTEGYGNKIVIRHDEQYQTVYAHLNTLKVKAGQRVPKGQLIGLVGSTGKSMGPHLHYEIHKDGKPVDPASYLK